MGPKIENRDDFTQSRSDIISDKINDLHRRIIRPDTATDSTKHGNKGWSNFALDRSGF